MTTEQRGFYWSEVVPGFAEGIDRLLDAYGQPLRLLTDEQMHDMFKKARNIYSTERLSKSEMADFISEIQALAAECMIFLASPEEWKLGVAERERENHYAFMFGDVFRKAA